MPGNQCAELGSSSSGARRRASGQHDDRDLISLDGDRDAADSGSRASDATARRMRFSAVNASTLDGRGNDGMLFGEDGTTEPQEAPGLNMDTRAAAVMGGEVVSGQPMVGSPHTSSSSRSAGQSRSLPTSSKSTRSRHRGMSLRSSLFTRNIDRKAHTGDTIMEMGPIESASGTATHPPSGNKKASQPSVTVSQVSEEDSLSTFTPPTSSKVEELAPALPNYQQWVQRRASRHLPIKRVKAFLEQARKYVLHIQDIPSSKDGRHIPLDASREAPLIDERTGKPFIGNTIVSSKYNAWNFLPRQLFAQFSKLANFYFLTVSILQMIPGLSTTGTYTTIVPLMFFVGLSMAKEGYEDFRRHRLDKTDNNQEATILHLNKTTSIPAHADDPPLSTKGGGSADSTLSWESVKWSALQVGDIVKLKRDDAVPADLVLLRSSGPNNLTCVETMALDGETNLKNKQPPPILISAFDSTESLATVKASLIVEDPNLDLYNFEGRVTVNNETSPLTNNEIIYRGSVLRNTTEAVGIVVYSGEECKIRMNATKNPRIKAPALQRVVNKIVLGMVFFVLFLALFNTIAYQVWRKTFEDGAWYLKNASVPFGQVLVAFIIMFNTLIPLSLYVSLEIIKVAQLLLLNSDIDMYDPISNTPFEAHTSTINEELGQIGYIFSDKTGTLTENVMRFRKLSVAGTAWLHDTDIKHNEEDKKQSMYEKRNTEIKSKGKRPLRRLLRSPPDNWLPRFSQSNVDRPIETISQASQDAGMPRRSISAWTSPAMPGKPQPELLTTEMIRYIQLRPDTVFARKAKLMILSLALCHTCLPERIDGDDNGEDKVSYQASSPDELALVQAASEMGFVAWERDIAQLTLKMYPLGFDADAVYETYEVLDVIEFSSKRKRMSVVVRFPDGRICIICKGADSVIMQRLRLAALAQQKLVDVDARANERKSMEAHEALRRRSSQIGRQGTHGSFPRTSTQLGKRLVPRTKPGELDLDGREVDEWLSDREHNIVASPIDVRDYSPRPSAQCSATTRPSVVMSDPSEPLFSHDDVEELVEESMAADDGLVVGRCIQHINDFATEGLRTLLYGYRFLDENEYRQWKKVYMDATTSIVGRQRKIEQAGELIEQQLELAGATAIEDKLQDGVPETIDRLRRANIKMWMLTGDKRETAINIGHSCRLIKDYSSITVLDQEVGNVEQSIAATINEINRGDVADSVIVVDGQTLATIDADRSLHVLFIDLAILADSVICCRASPSQKAGLVNAIRRRVNRSVTLAIGDGANDIAMIQEAHVGIGITGKEGLQAARTSDYSIAQFRFLTKLLLVHGRWNYIRTCKYTVGTFWKEMLFYLTQALYQRYAGYTGTSLYESWSLSMFNTLFTSLVVIFLGIFEQDLRAATLIAVPELYTKGQRSAGFNAKVYLGWMFMAASEAVIVYFTMWGLYGKAQFTLDQSLYPLGDMTFTACIIVIATKLQVIEQRYKSYMALIGWIAGVGGWFLWNIILAGTYSSATNPEYRVKGGFYHGFGRNALWWSALVVSVAAVLLFEVAVRTLKCAVLPTDVETFQTLEQDRGVRKRFEEASAPWLRAGWSGRVGSPGVEEAQARREGEVQELLSRPRVMDGQAGKSGMVVNEEPVVTIDERRSMEVQDMLSRRFGNVKEEPLVQAP